MTHRRLRTTTTPELLRKTQARDPYRFSVTDSGTTLLASTSRLLVVGPAPSVPGRTARVSAPPASLPLPLSKPSTHMHVRVQHTDKAADEALPNRVPPGNLENPYNNTPILAGYTEPLARQSPFIVEHPP